MFLSAIYPTHDFFASSDADDSLAVTNRVPTQTAIGSKHLAAGQASTIINSLQPAIEILAFRHRGNIILAYISMHV